MTSQNYRSIDLPLTSSEVAHIIGGAIITTKVVSGIQNNSGADINLKFNGGDGTFIIPTGAAYFEPFRPIQGTLIIWGAGAGSVCVLG